MEKVSRSRVTLAPKPKTRKEVEQLLKPAPLTTDKVPASEKSNMADIVQNDVVKKDDKVNDKDSESFQDEEKSHLTNGGETIEKNKT